MMKDVWTGIQPAEINPPTDQPRIDKWAILAVGLNHITVTDGEITEVVDGIPTVIGQTISFQMPCPTSLIYFASVGDWVHLISQGQSSWAFAIDQRSEI